MQDHRSSTWDRPLYTHPQPLVAVVGGGIAGLTCARELRLRGFAPVVFEAGARLGGRCSSVSTPVGSFDDGAQSIGMTTRLSVHAGQLPGKLSALHPWTIAATPAEEERSGKAWKPNEDEADVERTLNTVGMVGVPSMVALADTIARPLQVRLNTRIVQARRKFNRWALSSAVGEIEEEFQALVLAVPAPLAVPLVGESLELTAALRGVRYSSRWLLLLGTERPVPLPGYRAFQGSPIERVTAMHSKPGRLAIGPQRWLVEADKRWSLQHEDVDAETVADLLLENFRALVGRLVTPNYLRAQQWRHAFVEAPATSPRLAACLWDDKVQLGVCGDSVVASQVDRVHGSGIDMARAVFKGLTHRSRSRAANTVDQDLRKQLEAQL